MHSFYVVWTVRGHEWFFLVNNRLVLPVFIGFEEAVLRPLLTSICTTRVAPSRPGFRSSRWPTPRYAKQISPNKNVSYPCASSTSTFATLFRFGFVFSCTLAHCTGLYVVSVRNLAGLGVNAAKQD